jgi:hypothetical protein
MSMLNGYHVCVVVRMRPGVVSPMIEVLTGIHLEDKETCLRTCQCVLGICGNNEEATAAFKDAVSVPHPACVRA